MKVLLVQIDGKIPNIALMRLAAHHRALGHTVEHRWGWHGRNLGDAFDLVCASAIFEKSVDLCRSLLCEYPAALVGGTGWDISRTLERCGITTKAQDYSDYPKWKQSIGFSQRGCRLKCPFCVVPRKEGAVTEENTINEIWRGEPWPREIVLLDNDFFGQPNWQHRINEMRDGGFRVSFNQGVNARMLTDETAAAIAGVDYRADDMKSRRIYTAWDNRKDESRLFAGLSALTRYGVRPGHIMVYMLIGYWPGETEDDWEHRRARLREFGALPYPMPFRRTTEAVAFQRFVVTRYDEKVPWSEFRKLGSSGRVGYQDRATLNLPTMAPEEQAKQEALL